MEGAVKYPRYQYWQQMDDVSQRIMVSGFIDAHNMIQIPTKEVVKYRLIKSALVSAGQRESNPTP